MVCHPQPAAADEGLASHKVLRKSGFFGAFNSSERHGAFVSTPIARGAIRPTLFADAIPLAKLLPKIFVYMDRPLAG
jgi:hypothetical protein